MCRRLFIILASIFLIGYFESGFVRSAAAFCLFSCDPTEENARAVVENRLRAAVSNTPFKITSFQKINGQNMSFQGMQAYQLYYRALVEFPSGLSPGRQQQSIWNQLGNMGRDQERMMMLSEMGFRVVRGDKIDQHTVMESNSSVVFQKTEKGWLGQDGRVY